MEINATEKQFEDYLHSLKNIKFTSDNHREELKKRFMLETGMLLPEGYTLEEEDGK